MASLRRLQIIPELSELWQRAVQQDDQKPDHHGRCHDQSKTNNQSQAPEIICFFNLGKRIQQQQGCRVSYEAPQLSIVNCHAPYDERNPRSADYFAACAALRGMQKRCLECLFNFTKDVYHGPPPCRRASLLFGGAIEVIQPFVGRSGKFADFTADAFGALIGVGVGLTLRTITIATVARQHRRAGT